jgi:transcriptional regulator with XRE-family HTH domain
MTNNLREAANDVVSIDPFVQRLRDARLRLNMSQERFAVEVGTSRRNVLRWEGGYNKPSHASLVRIAEVSGVTMAWLVDGREERAA